MSQKASKLLALIAGAATLTIAAPGVSLAQNTVADRHCGRAPASQVFCGGRSGVRQMASNDQRAKDWDAFKAKVEPLLAAGRCAEAVQVAKSENRLPMARAIQRACRAAS